MEKKEASEKYFMKGCKFQILAEFCGSCIIDNNINHLRVDLCTMYL